ncbi:hypothetical protein XELAEV_18029750mg [Xenopus laevis]|uniref:Lysosomal dipeptide transporter MFSD1 n=1 Tax=Xenopus laevis TaxID=8355 RepID=A0A974HI18_XENLA|nr:hypothetical protein XELAEV_18029750mg [Xenopus laevis]
MTLRETWRIMRIVKRSFLELPGLERETWQQSATPAALRTEWWYWLLCASWDSKAQNFQPKTSYLKLQEMVAGDLESKDIGTFWLKGSYFCYDNPAALQTQVQAVSNIYYLLYFWRPYTDRIIMQGVQAAPRIAAPRQRTDAVHDPTGFLALPDQNLADFRSDIVWGSPSEGPIHGPISYRLGLSAPLRPVYGHLYNVCCQDMKVNTADFMQLYAFYSWPNVVLCFFGGFLIDRVFGIRLGTIIFSLFVCAGQVIFATGALVNAFWLMEAGRLVFGIGGESLAVAQNTYAVSWFKGKELNLVFGLQLSMARVGSTVNMNVMGLVYSRIKDHIGAAGYSTLGVTLMIGAVTCIFSLICALALGYLDKRAEKILDKEQGKTGEVIKITDVKDFSLSLWLIFIICVCYYVAVFPFIGLGKVFFIEKFQFSPLQAGAINSVVYIISAPLSPVLGFMVDRVGKNIIWVMCAVVATLASHLMLAFTFWNPWIAMSLLGVSYSLLACALWPMVAFVVPEHQLGTAYGFMQSIQNLGLAIIAIAAGVILDARGYLFLEVFFSACLCSKLFLKINIMF